MDDNQNKLDELRSQIDELDEKLLQIIAQRMNSARSIGQYKKTAGLAPLDTERWQSLLEAQLLKAESLNLSHAFITKLYELIHEYSLEIEANILQDNEAS